MKIKILTEWVEWYKEIGRERNRCRIVSSKKLKYKMYLLGVLQFTNNMDDSQVEFAIGAHKGIEWLRK